jgi:hypothetical protein
MTYQTPGPHPPTQDWGELEHWLKERDHIVNDVLAIQISGDHYKNYAIQPAEFAFQNKLSWHQGEIIKYVVRYKDKGQKADLEKAKHLLEMLIEFEYNEV